MLKVWAFGVLPVSGHTFSWDTRIDARIAWVLMSIHAMKGVEIGDGFELAGRVGSKAHDECFWSEEHGFTRATPTARAVPRAA